MYKSTRGNETCLSSKAILSGIAKDGGLYCPIHLGSFSLCESDLNLSYLEIAKKVYAFFLDDFSSEEIAEVLKDCYQEKDFNKHIVGLKKLGDFNCLSLYHGPTFAFKDMALSAISPLFKKAKEKEGNTSKNIILTATSGDTGSATLSGFHQDEDTSVVVLYPHLMISEFQEAQMHFFKDHKNHVIAIDGNFDDCQAIVKEAFSSVQLKHANFSSANSINIARIIPQVVYYFYSYLQMVKNEEIKLGEFVNFSVPTGNFGNILAGYYAKMLGCPIHKLITASNQNDVLTDFFETGIYNKNRDFHNTISPSMDILISSNLERLLSILSDDDSKLVSNLMNDLKEKGIYEIPNQMKSKLSDFSAFSVSEKETKETIKSIYDKHHFLVDPHTACGIHAYQKYVNKTKDQTKTIVLSTASPLKFSDAVLSALSLKQGHAKSNIHTLVELCAEIDDPRAYQYLDLKISRVIWSKKEALSKLKDLVGDLDVNS